MISKEIILYTKSNMQSSNNNRPAFEILMNSRCFFCEHNRTPLVSFAFSLIWRSLNVCLFSLLIMCMRTALQFSLLAYYKHSSGCVSIDIKSEVQFNKQNKREPKKKSAWSASFSSFKTISKIWLTNSKLFIIMSNVNI